MNPAIPTESEYHTQSVKLPKNLHRSIKASADMNYRNWNSEVRFRLEESFKRGTIDQVLDILQRIEKRLLRKGE